ncbi:hypothetical protein V6N13_078512 [Hibiscus sabdariffa]
MVKPAELNRMKTMATALLLSVFGFTRSFQRSLLLASALWLCLHFPASVKMIDDEQLGFLANFLGIFIFALVIAYHYVTADPNDWYLVPVIIAHNVRPPCWQSRYQVPYGVSVGMAKGAVFHVPEYI